MLPHLTLPHLDVAAVDRVIGSALSSAVSTAAGAGKIEAVCFHAAIAASTFAVVLHAHAKGRVLAVVGAVSLELHRVGSGGHRAALVADAAEECYLVDVDLGVGGMIVELEIALEAAVGPRRIETEVNVATNVGGKRAAAGRVFTHARVVLRIRQFDDNQATLVPAGIPEAVFYIVSRIRPGKVGTRNGSRTCCKVGKERGGRGIFGDMALLDIIGDLLRMLRIPKVDHADALIRRGIDHQPHVVAIVEIEVMHHTPRGIRRDVL